MQIPLAAALISFVITFAVARLMLHWSPRLGMLDFPDERKPHAETTAIGGIAVLFGVLIAVGIMLDPAPSNIGWVLGAVGLALIGVVDDRFELSAHLKLIGQILLSIAPILLSGIQLSAIQIFGAEIPLGSLAVPISMLWIVGITNAINLIDGLDGLAIGAVGIGSGAFFVINMQSGNELGLLVSAALIGAAVGFILFNAHPAKLFLGDGGSYFLGYCLALLALISFSANATQSSAVPIVVVILVLLYPITDTLWAIIRRMLAGRSIFSPDQQHLHHQIIKLKLDVRLSVLFLYLIFSISSLLGLAIYSRF